MFVYAAHSLCRGGQTSTLTPAPSPTQGWALLLLSENPDKLAKLRAEAERECLDVADGVVTYEHAKRMPYARAVILETLRLYPALASFPREAHEDVVLPSSGYDVPRGSMVYISQRALNRDPERWPRPNAFEPERFLDVGELQLGRPVATTPNTGGYAFVPFGASHRGCVGQRLALLEAAMIVASISLSVNVRVAGGARVVREVADATLGPKHGMAADVWARKRGDVTPRALATSRGGADPCVRGESLPPLASNASSPEVVASVSLSSSSSSSSDSAEKKLEDDVALD